MLLLSEKLPSALGYLHLALVFITESSIKAGWRTDLSTGMSFSFFFSFPVSGGKQGSYFFTLETSARQREETVRGQKLFSRVWRSWAFHSDGVGCSGEDRCRGSIFKHKVEQGNPDIKKVWRMASLETSWDPCPAPSSALGGTIGDLPCCVHAQSCPALCSRRDHSPAGSSARGIFQARILEQVAISTTWESSQPRDQIYVSVSPVLAGTFFTSVIPGKSLWGKRLEWSLRDVHPQPWMTCNLRCT